MFVVGLGLMRTNENFEPLRITTGFKTSGVWYVTINRPVFVIRITKIAIFQACPHAQLSIPEKHRVLSTA
jgi:hypothetical protein